MPKQRPPFDYDHYQALKTQGLSQREIARAMEIPESTLRDNLRMMQKTQASHGLPQADQGPPEVHVRTPTYPPEADQGSPQGLPEGNQGGRNPMVSLGPPQPDQAETAVLAGRATPPPPSGGLEDTQSGPLPILSTQDLQDLQALLDWWRQRHQQAQEPTERLERVTYHVAPKWIEAVRREADTTGDSYAAVVNRAFAQYFTAKST
jgi:hypothetical protein